MQTNRHWHEDDGHDDGVSCSSTWEWKYVLAATKSYAFLNSLVLINAMLCKESTRWAVDETVSLLQRTTLAPTIKTSHTNTTATPGLEGGSWEGQTGSCQGGKRKGGRTPSADVCCTCCPCSNLTVPARCPQRMTTDRPIDRQTNNRSRGVLVASRESGEGENAHSFPLANELRSTGPIFQSRMEQDGETEAQCLLEDPQRRRAWWWGWKSFKPGKEKSKK